MKPFDRKGTFLNYYITFALFEKQGENVSRVNISIPRTYVRLMTISVKESIVIKPMQMPLFDENDDGSLKEHKTGQMFL